MSHGEAKRALLAWEFGAGRSHARHLLGVAGHLKRAGVDCLAALYEPSFAHEFAAIGVPAVQTYVWPARRRAPFGWSERPVRALGDVLANIGFASARDLTAALAHYDGLFEIFRPDVVLAENAFGALLAARGRLPSIAFGTQSTLPPTNGNGFTPRRAMGFETPSFDEAALCAAIDLTLERTGRPALGRLSAILDETNVLPFGPAAFSLHGTPDDRRILPPFLPDFVAPPEGGRGEEVFAYLNSLGASAEDVLNGIAGSERPVRLHLGGQARAIVEAMPGEVRQRLVSRGVVLEAAPVPLPAILERSRCVLHHGGVQMTSACLAAGLPQVILPKEEENMRTGSFVAERRLGFSRPLHEADAGWVARSIRRAFDDADMASRCRAGRPDFAAWVAEDPTETVAREAQRAIGARDT